MTVATSTLTTAALQPDAYTREASEGIDRSCQDWYKDAVIYQLHVKAFNDSSGDGIGDFAGLMERLDYVTDLGVTAIWLLPFYPSPLRDDGYDIAAYTDINTSYGDLDAFKAFVDEAHRRGIRVITELVINHTSDQHPWFQRARQSPPGSPERDFYVWSDTDQRYQGTRIIFLDTETSNWSWDPVAKAYYWHRFYSHQPDLNFDNPAVFDEIVKVLRFWLDLGVDGLRLDAVPYLCEREGTNNENLPETHEILKRIRREVDAHYPDRMLLAEANQWPEDTRPYFGDGDECHTAFHFPLMPRMYMALAQEDRHAITDILRQTPEIPDVCQWALFLRNHDELTLEMVTDDERDYLWRTYASDARARINLGIRRRLAPLLDNDRRKIELMNALLLSMPGTPVIYYGDEIGMGDNYYLGDRDGVRTPMQWTADRNGGFSRADPQRLYLPPVMDANYGYQAINVEAQQRDPSSLLNWMRKIIAVRQTQPGFGRGDQIFLYPNNRKVLAFLREHEGRTLLCVFNMARTAQAVELDLRNYAGRVPVELLGGSAFPAVGELPYLLTLPAHGFFWFELSQEAEQPYWRTAPEAPLPDFSTVVMGASLSTVWDGVNRRNLVRDALPEFLVRRRWFQGKGQRIRQVKVAPLGQIDSGDEPFPLYALDVEFDEGKYQRYLLPLAVAWGSEHVQPGSGRLAHVISKVRRGPRVGALLDATHESAFACATMQAMSENRTVADEHGRIEFRAIGPLPAIDSDTEVRAIGGEQSNQSLVIAGQAVLKIYRRLRSGIQPELEVSRFLTEVAGFENSPSLLGLVEHLDDDGQRTALASVSEFVPNQGDCWHVIVAALERQLEEMSLVHSEDEDAGDPWSERYTFPLDFAARLGQRTAELHAAFATATSDPAFQPEPITAADLESWVTATKEEAEKAFSALARLPDNLDETVKTAIERLQALRQDLFTRIDELGNQPPSGLKTRIHGDYHLGQVMVAADDAVIIDFEGEPGRPLEERRAKTSALRDVAGMLRSFDYAAWAALDRVTALAHEPSGHLIEAARAWHRRACRDFMESYEAVAQSSPGHSGSGSRAAAHLELFLLQKALYEIAYEASSRPTWLAIPLRGVLDLLEEQGKQP